MGPSGLLAEAVGSLLGTILGVQQPRGAVCLDDDGLSWLSEAIPAAGEHWDPDMRDLIENPSAVASMLVLDALILNEDRHPENILVEPAADEARLRVWAIDFADALVGQPSVFIMRGLDAPNVEHHARGLPVDALRDAAMEKAMSAARIEDRQLRSIVAEACGLAGESQGPALADAFVARCRSAPAIVTEHLDHLGALR